jgi:hypothetical protein
MLKCNLKQDLCFRLFKYNITFLCIIVKCKQRNLCELRTSEDMFCGERTQLQLAQTIRFYYY